jgi:hypothetical protein
VQVAEYDCAYSMHCKPAFNWWWVQKVFWERNRLINKVSTHHMRKGSMKSFHVEVLHTIKDALEW